MRIFLPLFWITTIAVAAAGQIPGSVDGIVKNADAQTARYRDAFRNLIGDETKTFTSRRDSNEIVGQTVVRSSFFVYESGKDRISELRVVKEVNGTPIPDAQKRGEELLSALEGTTTQEKKLRRLERESTKYDQTFTIYGLTLFQGTVLDQNLRNAFTFTVAEGDVTTDGRRMIVLKYEQKAPHPYIAFNSKPPDPTKASLAFEFDLPKSVKRSDLRIRGTLWLDADFRIRREERGIYISFDASLPIATQTFEYADSEFGILLPKSISIVFNNLKMKDKKLVSRSRESAVFDYENFRRTNVEVKISDDEIPEAK